MGLWHAFSSTEKEKTMLNEKEFYQYVEANILNYLPEMEDQELSGTSVVSGDILSKLFKGTGIIRYDERYRQNLSRTSGWILSG